MVFLVKGLNFLFLNHIRIRGVGEGGLNSLRVTTHIYNTFEEVDLLLEAIRQAGRL